MELHFSHASRVLGTVPSPLETTRIVLTGEDAKLTAMLAKSIRKLEKAGDLSPEHKRLVDRRPVQMLPSTTQYNPPKKVKVRSNQAVAYDSPLLTVTQRACRTNTTKGEALDMTNHVAKEKLARKRKFLADLSAKDAGS